MASTNGRIQCTDGGMGQSSGFVPFIRDLIVGLIFLQPDMLHPDRIDEPDFEVKPGCALILLEFRVQQSPKTRR